MPFGFGKKAEGEEKLSGPKEVPEVVKKYLVTQKKKDPNLISRLKSVVRKSPKGENVFDVRLFDDTEAIVKEIEVKDYTTFDQHPNLIVFEGWFNKKSHQVELEEKKELKGYADIPILSAAEIQSKIEALTTPGSTVFFYLAGSPAYGGPLGRGAAVVELNPPSDKGKKYIVYVANVDGLEPVSKRQKIFDSNKAKDVASWVKDNHRKPSYY